MSYQFFFKIITSVEKNGPVTEVIEVVCGTPRRDVDDVDGLVTG